MANSARIVHSKTARATTGSDMQRVYGTDWNADHVLTGLENVDNTADAEKPISTATQAALDATLPKAGGTMTGGITAAQSGHFYEPDGAIVERFGDRVFIGAAVENTAAQTSTNNDWLTTFQISTGRTSGFIQTSQSAVLTANNAHSLSALTLAAQSVNSPGDFIGAAAINAVGVSNCTTYSAGAWAGYFEAYRMAGTAGAVGVEIDVINKVSESGTEPFTQSTGQTVGLQLGAGGDLPSTGQYSVSAAINVRANGSNFARGFVFGNDSIKGTDGTTGAGEAIGLATGHVINYYYGSGTVSWQLYAGFGVNGDYVISSQGTGSVSVPSLKETTGQAYTAYTPTVAASAGTITTSTATGRHRKLGKTVFFRITVTTAVNGTGSGYVSATLPFTAAAGSYVVAGRCSTSGKMLQGFISSGTSIVQIFNYDNSYPASDGATLVLSGEYEAA